MRLDCASAGTSFNADRGSWFEAAVVRTSGPPIEAVVDRSKTNSLAVVSLVAGIGSFFANIIPLIGGFTVALIAVITGHMARAQIKRTGEQGIGYATAGLILGYAQLTLIVLIIIGLILGSLLIRFHPISRSSGG